MSKKKAFVRYAGNKAVPGSLIVRTKAPKVGVWKEVPYDVCCGGGGAKNLFIQELQVPNNIPLSALQLTIACINYPTIGSQVRFLDVGTVYSGPTPTTPQEVIDLVNEQFSFIGTFTLLTPTTANLAINSSYLATGICENPQVEIGYSYA